ncbi:MAG: TonB-dependent receptor [Melioribacteraceae bacterium]|nr:TonB-dependent receptor [Melioribacteraceae bacterium]
MYKKCTNLFRLLQIFTFLLLLITTTFAGITGKLSGTITDSKTGEAIPGANIMLDGTTIGAATDFEGFYTILNIPPGEYKVKISSIGFRTEYIEQVIISIDRTTKLNVLLSDISLELEGEVVVVADREKIKTDVSFAQTSITTKDMATLPVSPDVREVIAFAPGVYRNDKGQIEIRGGQMDEVGIYVDDISMQNARTGVGVLNMPQGAIQEIQVIRGGFNAEYGQAQSGIINIVTKQSLTNYTGSININVGAIQQKHFGPNIFSAENYYHVGRFLSMDSVYKSMPWTGEEKSLLFQGWDNWWADSTIDKNDTYNKLREGEPLPYGTNAEEALEIWKYRHRSQEYSDEPDLNIDATLTGPVPFTSNKLSFFVAGHYNRSIYPFRFYRKDYSEYSGTWKLNYNINKNNRLSYHGLLSNQEGAASNAGSTNLADPRHWVSSAIVAGQIFGAASGNSTGMYNAQSLTKMNSLDVINHALKYNNVISTNSFFEVVFSYNKTKENTEIDLPFRDLSDIVKVIGGDSLDNAPYFPTIRVGDKFFGGADILGKHGMGGTANQDYDYTSSESFTFKADYTNQLDKVHMIKTGIWFLRNRMKLDYGRKDLIHTYKGELVDELKKSWLERDITYYEFAAYFQDKIEFEGLVFNAGIRMDGSFNEEPDLPIFNDAYAGGLIEDTLYSFPDSVSSRNNWKIYISPRIGVAHPISENSKLFFNYGYFYQRPTITQLFYDSYRPNYSSSSLRRISNSNLDFRKVIQYELGFEQMVENWFRITISGYYRDITNEIASTELTDRTSYVYSRYFANGFANVRGFEIDIRVPRHWIFSGWANFDYRTKTSGAYGYDRYSELPSELDREEREARPITTRATPTLRANLVIHSPEFENNVLHAIFSKLNVSLLYQWESGEWITWNENPQINKTNPFNLKWKDFSRLDLRIMKTIDVGSSEITFSFDIRNLLNTRYFNPGLIGFLSTAKNYTRFTDRDYFRTIKKLGLTPGDVEHPEITNILEQGPYWIFYGEPLQMWFGVEYAF